MATLIAKDSDGFEHIMWLQEAAMSCGPACVYMIVSNKKKKSLVIGETGIQNGSAWIPHGYNEKHGTYVDALAVQLGAFGIRSTHKHVDLATYTVQNRPMFIAHVKWDGGGAYFIVLARKTTAGKIVCLDPWYGLTETSIDALPRYSIQGNARECLSYARPVEGRFSGWIATTS